MQDIIYSGKPPKKELSNVFTDTMEELILEDSNVVYIDADLMSSMKSNRLWEKYPENVFNTGIQEANMVGVASGMYLTGLKPYIHTFAPFASRRALDQLYISVGYAKKSVRVIGSEPGICATDNGGTHMCFEDIGIMRTIPYSCIVDVSDAQVLKEMMRKTKDRTGITYIRTPRRNVPDIYPENTEFCVGQGKCLMDGEDITLIASGIMTGTAIEAASILKNEGINVTLIDPVTIKPLDKDLILESAKRTKKVLTIENHNVNCGLGGAVSEFLSEEFPVYVYKMGINDEFGQVGSEQYLREFYRLRVEDVVKKVKEILNK